MKNSNDNVVDVPLADLRRYWDEGLLRKPSGIQSSQFTEKELLRISLLKKAEALGFALEEIKILLASDFSPRRLR